jgi:hypothetical protein
MFVPESLKVGGCTIPLPAPQSMAILTFSSLFDLCLSSHWTPTVANLTLAVLSLSSGWLIPIALPPWFGGNLVFLLLHHYTLSLPLLVVRFVVVEVLYCHSSSTTIVAAYNDSSTEVSVSSRSISLPSASDLMASLHDAALSK